MNGCPLGRTEGWRGCQKEISPLKKREDIYSVTNVMLVASLLMAKLSTAELKEAALSTNAGWPAVCELAEKGVHLFSLFK